MYEMNHVVHNQPQNFKLNFITGFSKKTTSKLKTIDIDSMVDTKSLLQYL